MLAVIGFKRRLIHGGPSTFWTHLERGVVSVKGQDCAKFLHGLTTSNVNSLFTPATTNTAPAQFSAFLNHSGRVLFDCFLWNPFAKLHADLDKREVLVECQKPYVLDVMVHLHAYKARSRVTIEDVTERWRAVAALESGEAFQKRIDASDLCGIRDTRSPNWSMSRYLLQKEQFGKTLFGDLPEKTRNEYRIVRMLNGVPEGFVEIKSAHAIPFDHNLDLMGAIEPSKGCYTGQELVTRTLHQGQIRKRTHPIRLYNPDAQSVESEVFSVDGSSSMHVITETELMGATVKGSVGNVTDYTANYNVKMGRVVRTIGNVGIAIIREEHLQPNNRNFCAAISDRPSMVLCEIK